MARKKKSEQIANATDTDTDNAHAAAPAPAPGSERPALEVGAGNETAPDPALDLFTPGPGADVAALAACGRDALASKLDEMPANELYALRHEIDSRLPPRTLNDVDLVEELVLQYQIAKALLASVLNNAGVPANQRAQVLNSCTAVLKQVTETQTALYDAERVKLIEQAVEKAMAAAPQHIKEMFMTRYEQLLRESAGRKREKKA